MAQICGLMSQNPEPNKSLILYAVNTSNNHLFVLFKYLSWDVNYVIKYHRADLKMKLLRIHLREDVSHKVYTVYLNVQF